MPRFTPEQMLVVLLLAALIAALTAYRFLFLF
jgi:hypothetical protein